MSETPDAPRSSRDAAAAARAEEESLRRRWEATLRDRFDAPISRATAITRKTLATFPVRVWRHFLQNNGFLLAAGVSYQALFAFFAAIYVAFSVVGLWLGGSSEAIERLIDLINSYIPGLIAEEGGLATPAQLTQIATSSSSVLAITGTIALLTAIWTAIGFVTFVRRGVRDIFGLPYDRRSYVMLKARDLVAAVIFSAALVLGSVLTSIGTWSLEAIFAMLGWSTQSPIFNGSVRIASIVVSFVINAAALAALFRFLTGTSLHWRTIWSGSLVGGAGITILQLGAGLLLSYTPTNPLLATFAIFIGLMLWFRLSGIVMLASAAWIAVAAKDENVPLLHRTEAERLAEEHRALVVAAHVRLRTAQEARERAPWYRRWSADRAVREAEDELSHVVASSPAAAQHRGSLFE